ncbi:hypothetical protein EVG20_g1595 [Dentipellis fragilis]|uniref:Uncharacterized protein n=1 Tax=Dentipellis fragilis TaxID=205917 RepID=A0A4Y9ZC64_9AGAM|nr:hypothetical protein EVG20_g1595 [Dentipellis fragilis]
MPAANPHTFLFSSLNNKPPRTARKVHLRRLYDVFQLTLQRGDLPRARRAWAILVRCKEVSWRDMWRSSLAVVGVGDAGMDADGTGAAKEKRVEFLRVLLLQHPEEREGILQEMVLLLIMSGKHREALDELELYLPSFPFQDNPVLHIYAGLICLYLAQPEPDAGTPDEKSGTDTDVPFNPILLRDAQGHLERAKLLDPENVVAQAFLEKIPSFALGSQQLKTLDDASDDEDDEDENSMEVDGDRDDEAQRRKRIRT